MSFAVAYFALAELGHALSVKPGNFATMWPPSGLYLVALLLAPPFTWPRLMAAAAVANIASDLLHGQIVRASVSFWLANTLEAMIGASLVRWLFPLPFTLGQLKNTIGLACICGVVSAPCGAIVGALTVSIVFGAVFTDSWLTWWIADLVGILVFAPLVLAFTERAGLWRTRVSLWRILEAILFVSSTASAATVVFGLLPLPYYRSVAFMLYPFLLWGVLRFGLVGGSGGLALVSLIAISFTLASRGPFASPDLPPLGDIHLAQLFLSITALSFLTLAAVIHERDFAARRLGELYQAVRRSEKELRDVIETIPTSAWTALPDGSVEFVNRHWREYTGLSAEDSVGSGWQAAVRPEDLDRHGEKWLASLSTGAPFESEVRYRRAADGQYRWFLARAVPLRDEQGKVLRWYGISTDIDDRKRAEVLLTGEKRILEMMARGASLARILDSLCRLVQEQAQDVLASVLLVEGDRLRHGGGPSLPKAYTDAMDGVLIGPCAGSCGTAAYRGEQVLVSDIASDPLWDDYREVALAQGLRACWSTPIFSSEGKVIATFAMYYRERRSPSPRDQETIEQITHLAGVAIQRKLGEERLRESEARYRTLVEHAPEAIVVLDVDEGRFVEANENAARLFGLSREALMGLGPVALSPPTQPDGLPSSESALEKIRAAVEGGEPVFEWKYLNAAGEEIPCEVRLVRMPATRRALVRGSITDITERKLAQEDLRESERRYRHIFQGAGVSIWEEDFSRIKAAIDELQAGGIGDLRQYLAAHPEFVRQAITMVKVLDVNDAAIKLFGARSKDELLVSLDKVFLPETEQVFAGELLALCEGRTSFEAETVVRTLNGEKLTVLFTITFPLQPAKLDSVLVSIMDITDRKRAEQALHQTQAELAHVTRVTTMGQLTAAIAHEVKQPIGAAAANAAAALRWLGAQPANMQEAREALERIVNDAMRAGNIIGRIRELIEKVPPRKDSVDINEAVREVIELTRGEVVKHGVSVRALLGEGLPLIRGDRVQLQQVMLNLIVNAIEAMSAMSEGPRDLLISTAADSLQGVSIAVSDSGPGLPPEGIERVFDPFYTTKTGGLGMGLSICRSIIEAYGGRLSAKPNVPRGAVFQFMLPTQPPSTFRPGAGLGGPPTMG